MKRLSRWDQGRPSDYQSFFQDRFAPALPSPQREQYDSYPLPMPDMLRDEGKIQNEIARKFVQNKGQLDRATFQPMPQPPFAARYGMLNDKTRMDIHTPEPSVIAHELVHANDSQFDKITPKLWGDVKQLQQRNDIDSWGGLNQSLSKIQNKLNPEQVFARAPDYQITPDYINTEHQDSTSYYPGLPYKYHSTKAASFPNLFHDIDLINGQKQYHPDIAFNRLSEYPAFASERLHEPWGTAKGPQPLNPHEATFLHSMLGHMGNAYPSGTYPTMNAAIRTRRNSMQGAYPHLQPPPQQQPVSVGGFAGGPQSIPSIGNFSSSVNPFASSTSIPSSFGPQPMPSVGNAFSFGSSSSIPSSLRPYP
jgi:hypothetical protein